MAGISSPAAVPISSPARFSGRPRSAVIYSGISMIYMVLQVHISIDAINKRRTSRLRQALTGAIGTEAVAFSSVLLCSARGTEGRVNHTSKAQIAKVAAAIMNIQVNP
ncbi:hypothetical protein D3C80_1501440 [compost metagenome]